MSKFNVIQNAFTIGELSDRVKGRRDLREYAQGADEIQNMIVQKQGGLVKRPGFRYVADILDGNFEGDRIIPFVFSKNEAYAIIINGNRLADQIRIFRTDGTEATVDQTEMAQPLLFDYDPSNWKYAQSGDILVITYSEPNTEKVLGDTVGATEITRIPPAFIIRTDKDTFTVFTFNHPLFLQGLPSTGKFSPGVNRPYLEANVDRDIRFYVNTVSTGAGKFIFAVDSANTPVPFFEFGHTFDDSSGKPRRIGAFFKIQKSLTEGVCWGQSWPNDLIEVSGNIDIGTDIVTSTGHGLETRDVVVLAVTGGAGTTDPVISGFPLINNQVYGDFFIRRLSVNTLAFYTTQADADADSSRIDFTSAGDRGIRIQHRRLQTMQVTIEVAFEATLISVAGASDDWRESAWSAKRGFPRAVVFHESRLFFAGTEREPDTIWMSQTGNIFNFMQTRLEQDSSNPTNGSVTHSTFTFALAGDVKPTNPFQLTIASKQANIIQWLESQNVLLIGTLGSEYTLSGFDEIISNQSFSIKKQTDYGSNNTQAISSGVSILFVTRDGRRLRDFKFNRDNGSFLSSNLSVLADQMVFRGFDGAASSTLKNVEFKTLAYQPSRDVVWALSSNDELIALTFSREAEVVAWHFHKTRAGDTVKSLAVIPSDNGTFDQLWAVVERSIDGNTERYLEKMGDDFEHDVLNNTSTDDDDTPFYTDSSVKIVQGSTSTTVTLPNNAGIGSADSNLEGEFVDVLAGDVVEKGLTVSSGQITMTAAVPAGTVVVVGLPYISRLVTLDLEAGQDFGTSDSNRQRIDRLGLRFYKSQGGTYGNSNKASVDLFPIEYDGLEVFTGIKRVDFEATPDMDVQVKIEHDDPTPFNIVSITYRGVSYD